MTIPALIASNLLIGASVAYAARMQIRTLQRHVFTTRYFIALMLFEAMVMLPVGTYFYFFYTDWSWMYLIDTNRTQPGIGAMALSGYPTAAAMGYLVGYYSSRSGSDWITVLFMAFIGAGLAGLFIVAQNQFVMVGSFEQYHRDIGLKRIEGTSIVPSIIAAITGIAISWFYLLARFSKERRINTQAS